MGARRARRESARSSGQSAAGVLNASIPPADIVHGMRLRVARLGCAGLLALTGLGAGAATATAGWSNKANEIATLRSAATRFVTAELNGDGATACAVLNPPLAGVVGHRTCAQRWDASLKTQLAVPGERHRLLADQHAIATASVVLSSGDYVGTIALPNPLLGSESRFLWTENCWMLEH